MFDLNEQLKESKTYKAALNGARREKAKAERSGINVSNRELSGFMTVSTASRRPRPDSFQRAKRRFQN